MRIVGYYQFGDWIEYFLLAKPTTRPLEKFLIVYNVTEVNLCLIILKYISCFANIVTEFPYQLPLYPTTFSSSPVSSSPSESPQTS